MPDAENSDDADDLDAGITQRCHSYSDSGRHASQRAVRPSHSRRWRGGGAAVAAGTRTFVHVRHPPHRALREVARGLRSLISMWVSHVVMAATTPAPPWANMVRVAVLVSGPLLVGSLLDRLTFGALAATGAMLGAMGDGGGTFDRRLVRAVGGAAGGLAGLVIGRLLLDQAVVAVPTVALAALVSGVLSSINATLSFAGLQLLVFMAIASGPLHNTSAGLLSAAFLSGAGWSTLLSWAQTRIAPTTDAAPPAVAQVLDKVTALLGVLTQSCSSAPDPAAVQDAHVAVWDAGARAYGAIGAARRRSLRRRPDLQRMSAIVSAAIQVAAEAVVAPTPTAMLADATSDVRQLRDRFGASPLAGRPLDTAASAPPRRAVPAVRRAVDRLLHAATGPMPLATWPRRHHRFGAGRGISRLGWIFAARLAVAMTVAEMAQRLVPWPRTYWILLTVAVVIKPDLGSVLGRGVQRTLGTVLGVLLGTVVLWAAPHGLPLLIPLAMLGFLLPYGTSRNYGLASMFMTPLVLIFVELAGGGAQLPSARLLDTLIGAAIALLVGYLPWPMTWSPRPARSVATAAEAVADYAQAAFAGQPDTVDVARRRAYRALSETHRVLDSAMTEPPAQARHAALWLPLVDQLYEVADALPDAATADRRVPRRPDTALGIRESDRLHHLARAVRTHRASASDPRTRAALLAAATEEIRAIEDTTWAPGDCQSS